MQRISRQGRKFQDAGGSGFVFSLPHKEHVCQSCSAHLTQPAPPEPFQLRYCFYTSGAPSFVSTADFSIFTALTCPFSQATIKRARIGDIALPQRPRKGIPSHRVSWPALLHPLSHQLTERGLLCGSVI